MPHALTSSRLFSMIRSIQGCFRSFIQAKIIETCGCGSYKYPVPANGNITICEISKSMWDVNPNISLSTGIIHFILFTIIESCIDDYLNSMEGQNAVSSGSLYCKKECR